MQIELRQTFSKQERLHSKKLTDLLFKKGKSFFIYPFKVIHLDIENSEKYPAQILISASKRNFKKAVDRNKIKRLVREAYRLNKVILYKNSSERDSQKLIALIYTAKTIMTYAEIESKIILILQRLNEQDGQAAG